jgi:hypothetical protein
MECRDVMSRHFLFVHTHCNRKRAFAGARPMATKIHASATRPHVAVAKAGFGLYQSSRLSRYDALS